MWSSPERLTKWGYEISQYKLPVQKTPSFQLNETILAYPKSMHKPLPKPPLLAPDSSPLTLYNSAGSTSRCQRRSFGP